MDYIGNLKKSFASMKWYEWLMAFVLMAIATKSMVMAFIDPASSMNPPWLTVLNWISALCGAICIFFCAKASVSNFAFGLVNTIVYAIYLWYWKIYGTFCLEMFFYLPFNLYGWFLWDKHRDDEQDELAKTRKLTIPQSVGVVVFTVVSTIVYHAILVRVGGNVAWFDSMTVSIGIIATFLELLRLRESYALWIVQDVVAVCMYATMGDSVYLCKKVVYLIMAVIGLRNLCVLQRRNKENE